MAPAVSPIAQLLQTCQADRAAGCYQCAIVCWALAKLHTSPVVDLFLELERNVMS